MLGPFQWAEFPEFTMLGGTDFIECLPKVRSYMEAVKAYLLIRTYDRFSDSGYERLPHVHGNGPDLAIAPCGLVANVSGSLFYGHPEHRQLPL